MGKNFHNGSCRWTADNGVDNLCWKLNQHHLVIYVYMWPQVSTSIIPLKNSSQNLNKKHSVAKCFLFNFIPSVSVTGKCAGQPGLQGERQGDPAQSRRTRQDHVRGVPGTKTMFEECQVQGPCLRSPRYKRTLFEECQVKKHHVWEVPDARTMFEECQVLGPCLRSARYKDHVWRVPGTKGPCLRSQHVYPEILQFNKITLHLLRIIVRYTRTSMLHSNLGTLPLCSIPMSQNKFLMNDLFLG